MWPTRRPCCPPPPHQSLQPHFLSLTFCSLCSSNPALPPSPLTPELPPTCLCTCCSLATSFFHPLLLDNTHPPLGLCFGYALREAFLTLRAAPTPYFLLANAPCQGLCNYLINISLVHWTVEVFSSALKASSPVPGACVGSVSIAGWPVPWVRKAHGIVFERVISSPSLRYRVGFSRIYSLTYQFDEMLTNSTITRIPWPKKFWEHHVW